jgi:hypothetical protein
MCVCVLIKSCITTRERVFEELDKSASRHKKKKLDKEEEEKMSTACGRSHPHLLSALRFSGYRAKRRSDGSCDGKEKRRGVSSVMVKSASSSENEDEKFVPIDYESQNAPGETAEGRFGPDKILLVGFTPTEKTVVRGMLDDMGADFIELVTLTKDMHERMSLRECMEVEKQEDGSAFSVAGVQTKIVIMSGMIGAEVVSVVDAFYESQFKDSAPAFACAVPNSWEKPIKQTVDEICGDHAEVMKQRSAQ